MKTTTTILLTGALTLFGASCGTNDIKTGHTVLLIDKTESIDTSEEHSPEEHLEKLKYTVKDYGLWDGIKFEVGTITHRKISQTKSFELPPVYDPFEQIEIVRTAERDSFYSALLDELVAIENSPQTALGTSLVSNLVFYAGRLQRSPAQDKYLIISSDMVQESSLLNMAAMYNVDEDAIEERYPEIAKQLDDEYGIINGSGITVIISHKNNLEAEKRNGKMMNFWRRYLTERGFAFIEDPYYGNI